MKNIAVRTCGGCACEFDRRGIVNRLKAANEGACEFKFSYDVSKDPEFDLIVLINGCESACAPASETDKVLVIDHTNHEACEKVFAEATCD